MAYKLKRGNLEWSCEVIKSAHLSSGENIYLLKRDTTGTLCNPFVVGVRKGDDTLEFKTFLKFQVAHSYYLNMICCYV